jgi:hypothetical protein
MTQLTVQEHDRLIAHLKGVRKVVINDTFGGFGLSHEAILAYLDKCGLPVWTEQNTKFAGLIPFTYYLVPPEERIKGDPDNWHEMTLAERQAHNAAYSKTVFHDRDIARDDPYLVQVVEELGSERASGRHAKLKIVEIPAEVEWEISEYDGNEHVAEKHRTWY